MGIASCGEAVPTEEVKGSAKVQNLKHREFVTASDDALDDGRRAQRRKTDDCLLVARLIDGLHKNTPYEQMIENGEASVRRRVDVAVGESFAVRPEQISTRVGVAEENFQTARAKDDDGSEAIHDFKGALNDPPLPRCACAICVARVGS